MIKHYRTLLLVFALFCNTVVIQAQNVSLKLNNVTVKEAIEAVKKQTGKSFFFNVNDVDLNHRVNIDLKDAPLGKALSQILQGQDIDYEVKDNHIVLSKRNSTKNNQTFTVVGQVTDEKGMPLIGVNITARCQTFGSYRWCRRQPRQYQSTGRRIHLGVERCILGGHIRCKSLVRCNLGNHEKRTRRHRQSQL